MSVVGKENELDTESSQPSVLQKICGRKSKGAETARCKPPTASQITHAIVTETSEANTPNVGG